MVKNVWEQQSKNFQDEFKFQYGVKQSQSLAVQFTGAGGPSARIGATSTSVGLFDFILELELILKVVRLWFLNAVFAALPALKFWISATRAVSKKILWGALQTAL